MRLSERSERDEMGIKFGEIDATQIIENEYRIGILEHVLNLILQRVPGAFVSPEEMGQIQNAVITRLKAKYPNSGIGLAKPMMEPPPK